MTAAPISRYDGTEVTSAPPQVRLTADRARRWTFEQTSLTRRGYDPRAVDAFRIQVADELDVLAGQIANLRAENERINNQVELYRHGVIPSQRSEGPGAKEVNLLSAAQREAEQIIAQAHDYARRVADYARVQYEAYVQAAVEDARREAEQAVENYRATAGPEFTESAAMQEALRIYGEMMISHMEAAAKHLHDGSEHLSRTMDKLARDGAQPAVAGPGNPSVAGREGGYPVAGGEGGQLGVARGGAQFGTGREGGQPGRDSGRFTAGGQDAQFGRDGRDGDQFGGGRGGGQPVAGSAGRPALPRHEQRY
ncbi:DivIVA domain-containing protein [Plantactinospora sp. KBS50]|uniref:DivIVA domain-containing protein n=1 Tax=Plantactinospora sp. KBS50 TaxID=2024580 RepID=UPI001E49EDC0|nr:DivIVA domain-containing protein [Plantactinospora sp. KBS50]